MPAQRIGIERQHQHAHKMVLMEPRVMELLCIFVVVLSWK